MMDYTYQTEAEAWQAVADVLQSGEMPVWNGYSPYNELCIGLCSVVRRMAHESHISRDLLALMITRIETKLRRDGVVKFDAWGKVGRRLRIAQTFARRAAA